MLPPEPRAERPLLEGVVDRGRLLEDVGQGDHQAAGQLGEEEGVGSVLDQLAVALLSLVGVDLNIFA